jgi:hypothetical protein
VSAARVHHLHETNPLLKKSIPSTKQAALLIDDDLDCNRYFLEEFEDLNTKTLENKKLSYVQ